MTDFAQARAMIDAWSSARRPRRIEHWSDHLAAAIANDTGLRISEWAEQAGLSRETVSRGFRSRYGTSPAQFRGELRARSAWVRLTSGSGSLTSVAHEAGFADHAQMSHDIKKRTGHTPSFWRAWSLNFPLSIANVGESEPIGGAGKRDRSLPNAPQVAEHQQQTL